MLPLCPRVPHEASTPATLSVQDYTTMSWGYPEDEKVVTARDHLPRRQLDKAGLTKEEVAVDDDALRLLAGEYTREAGVRQLERAIARVLRKVTTKLAIGEGDDKVHVRAED